MVIARNNKAHQNLSLQLQKRQMGRYYLAMIDLPLKDNTIIEAPIARNPKNRLKMAVVRNGKSAKSAFYKLALAKNEKFELISAKLFSGRTHQIRVHLSSINRHILGDGLYGCKVKAKRVFLHAYILYLFHPATNKKITFIADLPQDFKEVLNQNFSKDIYEKINKNTILESFSTFDNWLFISRP